MWVHSSMVDERRQNWKRSSGIGKSAVCHGRTNQYYFLGKLPVTIFELEALYVPPQ